MQTCLYTHVPSYETQGNNETVVDSSENDAFLEFITEQNNWMPRTEASDAFCLDVVQQANLNDTLELNRQLHTTLQIKQNEISSLREKNLQLRDLVRQAEHLAHLLATIAPSAGAAKQTTACSPLSYSLGCSPPEQHSSILEQHQWDNPAAYESQHTEAFTSALPQTDETDRFPSDSVQCPKPGPSGSRSTGVKRCLWSSQDDSTVNSESASGHNSSAENAGTLERDAKRRRGDDQELLQAQLQQYLEDIERDLHREDSAVNPDSQSEGRICDPINIVGSFHGLKIVRTTPSTDTVSSEGDEAMCFKTSIREHSTIRTRVFPHGKSFTSPTPTGGYRFLWIPTNNSV